MRKRIVIWFRWLRAKSRIIKARMTVWYIHFVRQRYRNLSNILEKSESLRIELIANDIEDDGEKMIVEIAIVQDSNVNIVIPENDKARELVEPGARIVLNINKEECLALIGLAFNKDFRISDGRKHITPERAQKIIDRFTGDPPSSTKEIAKIMDGEAYSEEAKSIEE